MDVRSFNQNCQTVREDDSQLIVFESGNSNLDRSTHRVASTRLQQWTGYLSEKSTQVWNGASRISPLQILSASAQVLRGMGKYALVAMLISSTAVPSVNGAGLTITANPVYQVVNGVNTPIANPYISVAGADMDISCAFRLTYPLQGSFYSPGLNTVAPGSWNFRGSQESVNVGFQNLVFLGNRPNISANVNVVCEQGFDKNDVMDILLTSMPITTSSSVPSSLSSSTLLVTAQSTSTTQLATQTPLTPTSVPATISKLFTTTLDHTATNSQTMISGMLPDATSVLLSTLQPMLSESSTHDVVVISSEQLTEILPGSQASSPQMLGSTEWVLITVAGVVLMYSGLGICICVMRRKSDQKDPADAEKAVVAAPGIKASNQYDRVQALDNQDGRYSAVQNDAVANCYIAANAPFQDQNDQYIAADAPIDYNPSQGGRYIAADAPMDSGEQIQPQNKYTPAPLNVANHPVLPNPYVSAQTPGRLALGNQSNNQYNDAGLVVAKADF